MNGTTAGMHPHARAGALIPESDNWPVAIVLSLDGGPAVVGAVYYKKIVEFYSI